MTDKKKIILMVGLPILLLGGIGLYLATRKKLPKTDTNKNDKKMKFKIFDFLAISTTENTNFDIKVLT